MNRFLDFLEFLEFDMCSLTENFPLLYTLTGPCRKAKITEIRSFATSITAKSNSTILYHDSRENKLHRTLIKRTWFSLQCLKWCVCFHYSRRIPLSLGSVLEFRYQSLTLKYIEIGLFHLHQNCCWFPLFLVLSGSNIVFPALKIFMSRLLPHL